MAPFQRMPSVATRLLVKKKGTAAGFAVPSCQRGGAFLILRDGTPVRRASTTKTPSRGVAERTVIAATRTQRRNQGRQLSSAQPLPSESIDYEWPPHQSLPSPIPPRVMERLVPTTIMPPLPREPVSRLSPMTLDYTDGDHVIPITSKLHITTPQEDRPSGIWPAFRLMVSFLVIFSL